MIGIIDYGIGNLFSVKNALNYLEIPNKIITEPDQMASCGGLILPGVGAFHHGVNQLKSKGWIDQLEKMVIQGKNLLGICLGMQLLFEEGEEGTTKSNGTTELEVSRGLNTNAQTTPGLGFIPGKVSKFSSEVMVPHVGWSRVIVTQSHPLTEKIVSGDYFYFVHSYRPSAVPQNAIIGMGAYHEEFPCIVAHNNVMGTQFHPEKSSTRGLAILQQFERMLHS